MVSQLDQVGFVLFLVQLVHSALALELLYLLVHLGHVQSLVPELVVNDFESLLVSKDLHVFELSSDAAQL